MPPPNYLQPSYMGAMDQSAYFAGLDQFGSVYTPVNHSAGEMVTSGLSVSDLGMTAHPFQNQLQSLQAKIREGASKIEFEFAGAGKGNAQSGTPEMYGKEEREMMRKLAELNKVRTSTHATFSVSGLAGLGQRGFTDQAQHQTVQEVQRAIDFAKDATTGGAVVVHTGEWNRPISYFYGENGHQKYDKATFEQYPGEDKESPVLVVDGQTGDFVEGVSKNREVFAPKFHTAESLGKVKGDEKMFVGDGQFANGKDGAKIKPTDYVDMEGRKIDISDVNQVFKRVPVYSEDEPDEKRPDDVYFKTKKFKWEDIEKKAQEWNNENPNNKLAPEVFFARMQLENQILQFKGQSLFHLQKYNREREIMEELQKEKEKIKTILDDPNISEAEKYRLTHEEKSGKDKMEQIEKEMRGIELSMQHTHESSASADARAAELEQKYENLTTIHDYGIKRTAEAMARLAEEAMVKSKEAKSKRGPNEQWEDLYIAPENWHPGQYGSHPDELLEIVQKSREKFKQRLLNNNMAHNEEQAQKLAEKHIKTTFDIGHLNMWRSMMKRNPGESEEKFQKRFDNWVFDHLEKLHKANAIGHLHVTDNFGYNDEHVTIGQGNAPVKKFVNWMKDRGYKDFIVEAGSFNGNTIMHDAWSYLGAVPWKPGGGRGAGPSHFTMMHSAAAGLYAPPNYIVGAYVPSNEWTLWTGVPLE